MSITIFFFSVCIYLCFRYRKDTTFFRMKKEKGVKCNFTRLVKGEERVGIRKKEARRTSLYHYGVTGFICRISHIVLLDRS